jgi:multiple sugar transport system substrate-binding protein
MIKKRLVAVAAMATLSLTLAACGGGSSGSSGGQLEFRLRHRRQPDGAGLLHRRAGQVQLDAQLQKCGTSIGVAKVDHQSVPGPTLIQKVLQQASSKTLPDMLMLGQSPTSSRSLRLVRSCH